MIEVKNLYFKYEDEMVLKGISVKIQKGSFTAIIGPNGCGKTTLAKHFNSLLLPTKGSVFIEGINTKKDSFSVRKKVGFVFQNPEDQLVHSIAEDDIAFGLENLCINQKEMHRIVNSTMDILNISHLKNKNVNFISAGQKQLVALAGVLAMNPDYIVLDEPTTLLDSKNKKNIMDTLALLNKKHKKTIILITNLLDDLKYAKNIILIGDGTVIFEGKKPKLAKLMIKKAGLYE